MREAFEHRAVHARRFAATEFVPIVARELKLRALRQLELCKGDEVFKARFASDFLAQKPPHLFEGRFFGEPREQGVGLARSDGAQILKPLHEPCCGRWRLCGAR